MVLTKYLFLYSQFVAPIEAPNSFEAISSTLTSITIQWSSVECFDQNSRITGYIILISKSRSDDYNDMNITVDSIQIFTAMDLFPSTRYTFEIAAVSNDKTGPFASTTRYTSFPEGKI